MSIIIMNKVNTKRIQESVYNLYLQGKIEPEEWRNLESWDDIRKLNEKNESLRIPLEDWDYLSPAVRRRVLNYWGYVPDHELDKITKTGRYKNAN